MRVYRGRRRPRPDELLAAYKTMDTMVGWAYVDLKDLSTEDFIRIWGGWVEAKRQIAIATHSLVKEQNDGYHRAWEVMCR